MMPSGQYDYLDKGMVDARARHKTVNKLLKDYKMLQNIYRGQLEWHHYVFRAVASLVQMKIENDKTTMFQVVLEGDDDNY